MQLEDGQMESLPSDRSLLVKDGAGGITWFSWEVDDCLLRVSFPLTPKTSK